jgi:uncharacterized protein (DUF2267 family)
VFDRTLHKTHTWLKETMEALGTEDRHRAYMALRAVLHALRDRLKERHKEEFLAHVARELKTPSGPAVDPEAAARAVFGVLAKKVSEGELQDILGLLPKELKELWPKA